uniref:PLAT domain-containing protein n=1 Tax=Chenopodium quinoa TaxID=63459 RepID=A0A803MVR0_CHEQI
MELGSDGSDSRHSWYRNCVEVTTTGLHIQCGQQLFTVEQWLSRDRSHELSAFRENCNNDHGLKRRCPTSTLLPIETLLAGATAASS